MTGKLIKIDKNGSKYFEGPVTCDRCGGDGIYKWGAVINGRPQYAGTCFKCGGAGRVIDTWIERTPEYQAKLDAQRETRRAKRQAEYDRIAAERRAEQERREAERKAEQERREAERKAAAALSQYVGEVGARLTMAVSYVGSPSFERAPFRGWGDPETCYIHTFKDAAGNKIVWKTTTGVSLEPGQTVQITGTVKEHSEYRDEKQTVLQRCRIA